MRLAGMARSEQVLAGRLLLAAALAILSGALGALVLYQTSLQPGTELVAWVFNRDQLMTPPPGFSSIRWVRAIGAADVEQGGGLLPGTGPAAPYDRICAAAGSLSPDSKATQIGGYWTSQL